MPRKKQPVVAFLSCKMWYPNPPEPPLAEADLRYINGIEASIRSIKLAGLTHSVSSAEEIWDGGRVTFCEEEYFCDLASLKAVDRTEAEIVKRIRRHGIRKRYRFFLKKQILLDNEDREVFDRRVYYVRNTRWVKYEAPVRLPTRRKAATPTYPARLKYTSVLAGRCHGLGGSDIFGLFPRQADMQRFFASVSASDNKKLVAIYREIAARRDNEWLHHWLRDYQAKTGDDYPEWVDELLWLLAFLDRLREGGLLKNGETTEVPVLLYWDDYLCGTPCTESAV